MKTLIVLQAFNSQSRLLILFFMVLLTVAPFSPRAQAQNGGNNAIYTSSGCCGASSAFIDASATPQGTDMCQTIYYILTGTHGNPAYPASGAVIDARGLSGSPLTCASGTSPWLQGGTYISAPSVLLLPSGNITISYTWVLPNNTKVIGEGSSISGSTGTVLVAGASFSGPSTPVAMIQFGDSHCGSNCFRISVEDLTLNNSVNNDASLGGILNLNSQELTYARRISLLGITGVGLQNGAPTGPIGGPQNAGPYEQIYYSSNSGTCAQIYGASMRGIHGITCIGNTTTPIAGGAIQIDSSSNSLEDVYVNGYTDGVLIGSQATTNSRSWGNVVFNVNGGSSVTDALIHLCGTTGGHSPCPSTSSIGVQDTSILGATSGTSTAKTIYDDASQTPISDTHVAMYALGDAIGTGGLSRFTTSLSAPSWFSGPNQATNNFACSAAKGSLYSTSGSGSGTIWACVGSTAQWKLLH